MNSLWSDAGSPRIWRCEGLTLYGDEVFTAPQVCTDAALRAIANAGFTGIWFEARLYALMTSTILPELNDPKRDQRIDALRHMIQKARKHGLGVWLYFNEPNGVEEAHELWRKHPEIKGEKHWNKYALCPSTEKVQAFLPEATESLFRDLQGLAGIILITSGEDITHCWSKRQVVAFGGQPPACPRCSGREPAEIVIQQIRAWTDAVHCYDPSCRVFAWNWEWCFWYADPQEEIIRKLPAGVELLLDLEIGGWKSLHGKQVRIGEYSLSYPGPGERFVAARKLAKECDIPAHAKIEMNATHEFCSVPNMPVIHTLHTKFKALTEHDANGFLGCWSQGVGLTLNTAAMQLFMQDPARYAEWPVFASALAREYFGLENSTQIMHAWEAFGEAFQQYPFSIAMLYFGPHNDAPARPLLLHYEGKPSAASFKAAELGDDISRCLGAYGDANAFTLDEVISSYSAMADGWNSCLAEHDAALGGTNATELHLQRRRDELRCARMIGLQLRSIANVFRFHKERLNVMAQHGLCAPCLLPLNDTLAAIMRDEIRNAEAALPLVAVDHRLGFHRESQSHKYDERLIRQKIAAMRESLLGNNAPQANSESGQS